MFETLASLLNQGLAYIIPMIVLLGLLIFVHELGHFLAAKYYKVRVETFSLGFGPKIFKFVYGDTLYCISALPLGGYVKMYGDDPGKNIPEELKQKSYLHKPVGQRIVIALAGPLMNLFFAGFLFYCIAHIGDKAISPSVGEIALNSQAYDVGFRPYDNIVSINGQPIENWDMVKNIVENSAEKQLIFNVERLGQEINVQTTPESSENDNLFSTADRIGKIKGLNPNLHLPVIGVPFQSPVYLAGLRSGDRITEIDGEKIEWFRDIEPTILESLFNGDGFSELKIYRYKDFRKANEKQELTIQLNANNFKNHQLGFFIPETIIAEVQKDHPLE